ncbi:uncharacterized protein [Mytilus edulis]|uniref:uncharacterized protein n=1 Tax=Mytilus edulis TaxID=6550 RepID=UPI0039EEA134
MTDLEGNFHTTMLEAVNAIHFIEPMHLPKGKQYHIYMSYASSDSDFARQLENLLLEKGFKCCMNDRDFTPGKHMTETIRDCMRQSVQVVVLLSKNYINSYYLQLEHLSNWITYSNISDLQNYSLDFNLHEIERFKQLVEKGSEQRHYVRIVVVGEQGAGKSCLVHRLIDKDIKDVVSTDCLDIQINVCGIDLDTAEWCFINEDHFSGTTRLGQKLKNVKHNTDSTEVFYNRKEASNTDTQPFCKQTRADTSANEKSSVEAISKTGNDFYWTESLSQVNAVKPFNRRLACVSFWDFAGHTEYYPTHQLFLSRTCIVLLVTDITRKIGDLSRKSLSGHFMDVSEQPMENVAGYIDYWSSCIHTFGYTCPSGSELNPPIIVVTTHTDEIQVRIFSPKETETKFY